MSIAANLFVIFGATGDLAERMLLPSLYCLHRDGLLPSQLVILGTSRSNLTDAEFAEHVRASVEKRVPTGEVHIDTLSTFLMRVRYQSAAFDDAEAFAALRARIIELRTGDVVYHLSTAPKFYSKICANLSCAGLSGPGTRVLLE